MVTSTNSLASGSGLRQPVNNFLRKVVDKIAIKFLNAFVLREFCEATIPRPRLTPLV